MSSIAGVMYDVVAPAVAQATLCSASQSPPLDIIICLDVARCCACELSPASTYARPDTSYRRRSATRDRISLSSRDRPKHAESPDLAAAERATARCRLRRMSAASACAPRSAAARAAAMPSMASNRTRSRSTSTERSAATAPPHGLSTTARVASWLSTARALGTWRNSKKRLSSSA
nr:unnamed protein product [Digitaria exilis]